jgi:hypothetical protein
MLHIVGRAIPVIEISEVERQVTSWCRNAGLEALDGQVARFLVTFQAFLVVAAMPAEEAQMSRLLAGWGVRLIVG